jgi:hypothetical protein
MSWGGPEFVVLIILISTIGWIANTWIRARHGYPVENEWSGVTHKQDSPESSRRFELLTSESAGLKAQMSRLEDRIAVLEQIATDPAQRTAREIENLR